MPILALGAALGEVQVFLGGFFDKQQGRDFLMGVRGADGLGLRQAVFATIFGLGLGDFDLA